MRTVMVTGDSATTAAAIAHKVGIPGQACSPLLSSERDGSKHCGVTMFRIRCSPTRKLSNGQNNADVRARQVRRQPQTARAVSATRSSLRL